MAGLRFERGSPVSWVQISHCFRLSSSTPVSSGSSQTPMPGQGIPGSQNLGAASTCKPPVGWGEQKVLISQEPECSGKRKPGERRSSPAVGRNEHRCVQVSRIQVHWPGPQAGRGCPVKLGDSPWSPRMPTVVSRKETLPQPSWAGSGGRQAPASGDKVIPSLSKPTYLPLSLRCCQAVMQRCHQGPVIGGRGGR